jgi:NAD-dependent SIR2 family protein deacetylase
MSVHQLLGNCDVMDKCMYCGNDFNSSNWESNHYSRKHYKINTCEVCGKSLKVLVDFEGSGHDSWAKPLKFDSNKKINQKNATIEVVESPLEKAIKNNKIIK